MEVIDLVSSHGDGIVMEDIGGFTENLVWVLDGATGLQKNQYFNSKSDAFWIVNIINDFILRNSNKYNSLVAIMREASAFVKEQANKFASYKKIKEYEFPSYAIAFARIENKVLHYLVLGDCYIVIRTKDEIKIITDENFQMNTMEKRLSMPENEKDRLILMKTRRSTMNKVGGYMIGSIEGNAYYSSLENQIELADDSEIILCSDGFSRAVDKYNLFSWKKIFSTKLSHVVETTRMYEKQNQNVSLVKKSDDIFAIKVSTNG